MFVRQGSFELVPGKLDGSCPIVAVTIWQSEEHARAYDASGTAQQVVAKVKSFFAGPPTLRSSRIRREG